MGERARLQGRRKQVPKAMAREARDQVERGVGIVPLQQEVGGALRRGHRVVGIVVGTHDGQRQSCEDADAEAGGVQRGAHTAEEEAAAMRPQAVEPARRRGATGQIEAPQAREHARDHEHGGGPLPQQGRRALQGRHQVEAAQPSEVAQEPQGDRRLRGEELGPQAGGLLRQGTGRRDRAWHGDLYLRRLEPHRYVPSALR
jgi:hypothetical protein